MRGAVAALTGAAGFLGGHVAQSLAARGWRLRLLVRNKDIPPHLADLKPEIIRGDLDDKASLQALVRDCDLVVHAAGLIGGRTDAQFFRVNTEGSRHIGNAIRDAAPDARFLIVSSIAAREPHLSAYAASKRAGEEAAVDACGRASVAILRPTAVYGPWDRETLRAFLAVRRTVIIVPANDGKLSLLHARDFAEAVAVAAENRSLQGTFEVTDDRWSGYSWDELVAALSSALGCRPKTIRVPANLLRAAAPVLQLARLTRAATTLNPGKLREILHDDWSSTPSAQLPAGAWRPSIGLETGLAQTARWYVENGWIAPAAGPR